MRSARTPVVAVLATVLIAGTAWQASAAPSGPITVKVAKQKGGPYVPDRIELAVDHARDLYLRASTGADEAQTATLADSSGGPNSGDYRVRWYLGKKNITDDVGGDAYEFKLKKGKPKTVRINVQPLVEDPGAHCIHGAVHVEPGAATGHGQFELNGPSCI